MSVRIENKLLKPNFTNEIVYQRFYVIETDKKYVFHLCVVNARTLYSTKDL